LFIKKFFFELLKIGVLTVFFFLFLSSVFFFYNKVFLFKSWALFFSLWIFGTRRGWHFSFGCKRKVFSPLPRAYDLTHRRVDPGNSGRTRWICRHFPLFVEEQIAEGRGRRLRMTVIDQPPPSRGGPVENFYCFFSRNPRTSLPQGMTKIFFLHVQKVVPRRVTVTQCLA